MKDALHLLVNGFVVEMNDR